MLRLSAFAVTTALVLGSTPAQAMDELEELTVMSNEQYEEMLGSRGRAAAPPVATPRIESSEAASAAPGWATVKFNSTDRRGKVVPTRVGNNELGWKHFSSPHNITNPDVVKKIIGGTSNPTTSRDKPHRLVYDGALVAKGGLLDPPRKIANIRIIVQYHWQTADNRYSLSDRNAKIGVITAYCRSVPRNRCPDKVNQT
ncbi:hypothetical protein [Streptomyces sp. NBC_00094]|uniref:hypothetical protein n=1 Tax=Streptomyces sp. NBC_00094 TaxID=2903620 RepID=UPI00224C91E7|nr:hypothetical protein [Streptomyces sp. NBC_00094]MCX5394044.1 hypothetical protein [Streptomyces sp. NBC_00094]